MEKIIGYSLKDFLRQNYDEAQCTYAPIALKIVVRREGRRSILNARLLALASSSSFSNSCTFYPWFLSRAQTSSRVTEVAVVVCSSEQTRMFLLRYTKLYLCGCLVRLCGTCAGAARADGGHDP
jgi:hypothetical protein